MKLKIENATKYKQKSKIRQKTDKKPLRFHLCVVVSMCVHIGEGVCVCVGMRVFKVRPGTYIYIYIYIFNQVVLIV